MNFFETSAFLNDGSINDVFTTLANKIKETFDEKELAQNAW